MLCIEVGMMMMRWLHWVGQWSLHLVSLRVGRALKRRPLKWLSLVVVICMMVGLMLSLGLRLLALP